MMLCWGGEKHSTFLLGMLPQSEQANYPPVHLRSSWGVSHNLYHPFPISEGMENRRDGEEKGKGNAGGSKTRREGGLHSR
jgi:hypothetical protein